MPVQMLCKLCAGINVTDLVDLAKTNYRNSESERRHGAAKAEFLYWKHCASYEDLVATAQAGCELCEVLLQALDEEIWKHGEGIVTYRDALLEMEKDGSFLGFHVTIDSEDKEFHGSMSPEMIPRDRGAYLKDRFAAVEPRAYSNALGNSSASATLNVTATAMASAPAPSTENGSSKSAAGNIKPTTQYIMSYNDMILDRLTFHFRGKSPDQHSQGFQPLTLSLQVPRGQAKFVGPLQIGHFALDPNLGSETNFDIARNWIKDCSEKHDECPPMDDKPLPTRVINVGSIDRDPFLVSTNRKRGEFIALSHCWGGSVADEAKLTADTIELFRNRIPMADLPANFVDAVLITRSLGLEYLWIDCLCIMQDSPEDWDVESKHMGDIYRDAIVTLAAAAASKATDGMLHTFSTYDLNGGPPIKLKLAQDSPSDDIHIVRRDKTREDLGHLLYHGPLANRGWTLQEEILSPRTLYYGSQQIHWQCLHHYSSGDGIHDYDVHWKRAFRYEWIKERIFKQTHSPDQDPHDPKNINQILLEYHNEMVVDYCKRRLTFASDKFPAFSGIASLMHGELRHGGYLNVAYLAGIWSSHFREGLIWYYGKKATSSSPTHPNPKDPILSFPTWSWANVKGRIKSLYTKILPPTSLDPILLSHNCIPASTNPYGAIKSAELVVRGYILPMRVADHGVKSLSSGQVYWDPELSAGNLRGFGRKSEVWMVKKSGDSWLVVSRGNGEKGDEEKVEGIGKEKSDSGKYERLPYKVLFVASQKRYAFGLVLQKVRRKSTTSDVTSDPNLNSEAKAAKQEVEDTTTPPPPSTASKSPDSNSDLIVNENNLENLTKTSIQDPTSQDQTQDADTEIPTYQRIGLIKLQLKVATKNWNPDQFKWMDMAWEPHTLRLV